jgi:serine/threonine-protein kinase
MPLVPALRDRPLEVRLLRDEEIPPGFVYVPEGPFTCGDDDVVDFSLRLDHPRVSGFFLSRVEVTFRQYLEFLNALETVKRMDENHGVVPQDDFPAECGRAGLISQKFASYVELEDRVWKLSDERFSLDWPVFAVSACAAAEYALWRESDYAKKYGRRWRLRLPGDLEWEKAARGVDRRAFVWG